jgi:hypothetical protein
MGTSKIPTSGKAGQKWGTRKMLRAQNTAQMEHALERF